MSKNLLLWTAGAAIVLIFLGMSISASSTQAVRYAALPVAPDLVPNGTHFLVRLDEELDTGKDKLNKKFQAKTIDPMETSRGYILSAGANIHGHISRIEPGSVTGHARLWLTFDDIDTSYGRLPIVAEVSSVPGDFSVRPGPSKEGEIEVRTGNTTRVLEAAAAGAAIGAAAGAAAHNSKAAAIGAATGGVAAFVASSGIGKELDLPKGTKLDLVLDRPLYLNQ